MRHFRIVPVLALFVTSPAFAGWSLTQVLTGDTQSRQKMWLEGSSARVEFESSDNPMLPPGAYLLIQEGGRRIVMVDPAAKTYARLDVSGVSSRMESMGGGALETTIESPMVEKLL